MTNKYILPDERELYQGQAFKLNDISYPSNWLEYATPAELSALNITVEEVVEPEPDPPTVQELLDYAANVRRNYANDNSTTIDVGDSRMIPVWTDPESRGSILGLVIAAQQNPSIVISWKGSDGNFYDINATEISAIAQGMMTYVQSCFEIEAQLIEDINANTVTTYQQIDEANWPS